jgi:hypothetical protein
MERALRFPCGGSFGNFGLPIFEKASADDAYSQGETDRLGRAGLTSLKFDDGDVSGMNAAEGRSPLSEPMRLQRVPDSSGHFRETSFDLVVSHAFPGSKLRTRYPKVCYRE